MYKEVQKAKISVVAYGLKKNRDGGHLDGAFYFLLSAVGSHSRAESRQVLRS